jgi:hypothetical protein
MRAPRGDGLVWRFVWPGLALLAGVAACTGPYKLISARHVSCPPRKLEIRDLVSAPMREDWIAVCGEKTFACSTRERGRRLIYACHALPRAGDAGAQLDAAAVDASAAAVDASAAAVDAGVATLALPPDAGQSAASDAAMLPADAGAP